jgi:hypothetical protein
MQKRILCYAVALLFSSFLPSQEVTAVYSADKPIWDLRNFSDATDMSAQDDGTSQVFNLGFDFDFFGQTFDKAYMASNGCLILGQLATGNNWEKNCTQYEPSEAPNTNYTMYPFWTDLIMGGNSSMLAMQIDNKVIFGWYEMWEYYRDSKNTFELWLYPNNSYEARYSELDIKDHDVFIGIQGNENERETYYFHDKCFTGQVNSKECVSQDWNDTTINFDLENNGSILVGEALDCSNPLNDTSCAGYAAAYQTQQCDIDQLYNELCPYYSDAYDDFQCDLNPQYGPFCRGYTQEDSVAYFDEEQVDYGFNEEDMWYDEEYDEWLDPNDPCYQNNCEGFTDADWYALDTEQFGQEQVDEWFGTDIQFNDDGMVNFETTQVESYDDVDAMMDVWDLEQEQYRQEEALLEEFLFQESFLVEDYSEPETFIEFETIEQLEEWFDEETNEHFEEGDEEEFATLDEPEEEFIEEIFEEEVVEDIFEDIEERMAEAESEEQLEREEAPEEFEENFVEEFQMVEREEATGKSSITRELALQVVSSALVTATQSVGGVDSGNSVHATGNTVAAGNSMSSSSNSGFSTSSSPSISDQFASASVQTNETLSMSVDSFSSVTSGSDISTETTFESTAEVLVAEVQVDNIQGEIDTAVSEVSTASEADKIADQIIAANIKEQQEEIEQEQQDTGQYGDESTLVALIGYLPAFDQYRAVSLPDQKKWYSDRVIYTTILNDNTQAFYGLAGQSIKTLNELKKLQPAL